MLKTPRKIFSITQIYDANFIFPGAGLPGPEPVYLTEVKEYKGKTYNPGFLDPEWVKPDDESIPLGEYQGRFWYSLRDDISTDAESLGNPIPELDPQVHETLPPELYNEILNSSGAVRDLQMSMGVRGKNSRFAAMFPDADALASALKDNPEVVEEFLAQEAASDAEIMSKLGAVKAS